MKCLCHDVSKNGDFGSEFEKDGSLGCCLPTCQEMGKSVCKEELGVYPVDKWTAESCGKIEECQEGCCEYQCTVGDMPKAMCEHVSVDGKWTKGMCTMGCCELQDGSKVQLSQKTCLECNEGSNWKSGECFTGYASSPSTSYSGPFGGGEIDAEWGANYIVGTCDKDPMNAQWKGTFEWVWQVTFPDSTSPIIKNSTENITFITQDGFAAIKLMGAPATIKVSKNSITISFTMEDLGEVTATAPISKGYPTCNIK